MIARLTKRLVREGEWVAEVQVRVLEDADKQQGWAPYVSLEDAYKLDDVREALRTGDLELALMLAEDVYQLTPVAAPPQPHRSSAS